MGGPDMRRRRQALMAVSPYCDECGVEVFDYELAPGQKPPPNMATVQHVNSRIRYPDGRPRHGQRILMCFACNQEDAKRERAEVKAEQERAALIARVLPPQAAARRGSKRRPL